MSAIGAPDWVRPEASFDLDFQNNRYFPKPVDTALITTRTTNAGINATNQNYVYQKVGLEILRISNDEITNQPAGLLIEEAVTNGIAAADMAGAKAGLPGVLPTGWDYINEVSLTPRVDAVADGSITVGWKGTARSASRGALVLRFAPWAQTAFPAVSGDTVVGSVWVRAIRNNGIAPPLNYELLNFYEFTASGALIPPETGWTYPFTIPISPVATDVMFPIQFVYRPQSSQCARVQFGFGINCFADTEIDAVYQISRPQIEKRAFRTTFINGTKGNDVVTLASASGYVGTYPFSSVITADIPRKVSEATLLEISDGSADNRISFYYSAGSVYCEVVRSGSPLTPEKLGVAPGLTRVSVAFAASTSPEPDEDRIDLSFNGKEFVSIAGITLPTGLNKVQYGGG